MYLFAIVWCPQNQEQLVLGVIDMSTRSENHENADISDFGEVKVFTCSPRSQIILHSFGAIQSSTFKLKIAPQTPAELKSEFFF